MINTSLSEVIGYQPKFETKVEFELSICVYIASAGKRASAAIARRAICEEKTVLVHQGVEYLAAFT
jgi:hypothetical protein